MSIELNITPDMKQSFIELAISRNAIKFGEFKLKSGRSSPYFFNAGVLNHAKDLALLGNCYAETLVKCGKNFDLLFGPAYKGISLAVATAVALANHQIDTGVCFNRKEAKDHGEGGKLVGAPLKGKVMIIDDVITAGTAIRESIEIIQSAGAQPVGIVIALDRQEKGNGDLSAVQEVEKEYALPVYAIINLTDLDNYLKKHPTFSQYSASISRYRELYGTA